MLILVIPYARGVWPCMLLLLICICMADRPIKLLKHNLRLLWFKVRFRENVFKSRDVLQGNRAKAKCIIQVPRHMRGIARRTCRWSRIGDPRLWKIHYTGSPLRDGAVLAVFDSFKPVNLDQNSLYKSYGAVWPRRTCSSARRGTKGPAPGLAPGPAPGPAPAQHLHLSGPAPALLQPFLLYSLFNSAQEPSRPAQHGLAHGLARD